MAIHSLDQVESLIEASCSQLRAGSFGEAASGFERALGIDFDHPQVLYALKCLKYFDETLPRLEAVADPLERGDAYVSCWKAFRAFERSLGETYDDVYFGFKCFMFLSAQTCYGIFAETNSASEGARDLAIRIGRCLKTRGDFEGALRQFETATKAVRDDAEALAELADAYALVNETRIAKALFREAFFVNPARIDLDLLESPLIRLMIEKVSALGYGPAETAEWIPVYGTVWGVFSVKRELKAIEAGRLRQAIYQLENEVKEGRGDGRALVPRLLNKYFWQVDHFITNKEERTRIDEVLLKIKLLDPAIHKAYIA